MLEIRCICVLCLLITPGTPIFTKYVCPGDCFKMFETDAFSSQDTVISLLKNHKLRTLIAQKYMQNSTIKLHIQPDYEEKVYFDKYGNLWIRNVNHWDEESYFIESTNSHLYKQYEVKLIIMVAPEKSCKPKIILDDNHLIASLQDTDCGIPAASLKWLDSRGLSNKSGSVIYLHPGHEDCTYYACLKGPALECAKFSVPTDYCSSYTIDDSRTLASGISDLKTVMTVMVTSIIVIGSLVALIVAIYFIQKFWRRCHTERKSGDRDEQLDLQLDSAHENEDAGTEHPTCTSPDKSNTAYRTV